MMIRITTLFFFLFISFRGFHLKTGIVVEYFINYYQYLELHAYPVTFFSASFDFRLNKTKFDFLEPAMAIWSGNSSDLMRCNVECAKEQFCVSILYDKTTGSCKLFNVVFDIDESGNIDYWILNRESTRWGKLTYVLLKLILK